MMQQMMESPMMQSLLSNPEVCRCFDGPFQCRLYHLSLIMFVSPQMMRQMMEANPEYQRLRETNPEIAQAMLDPETLRQGMRAATNPAIRDEMMRQQDVAMRNIESMPGGFAALRNAYVVCLDTCVCWDLSPVWVIPSSPSVAARYSLSGDLLQRAGDDAAPAAEENPFSALVQEDEPSGETICSAQSVVRFTPRPLIHLFGPGS